MLENLNRTAPIAVDTETTGLVGFGDLIQLGHWPARPFAFSFTDSFGNDAYIRFPVNPYTREVLYREDLAAYYVLKDFFADPSFDKIFHNAQFDLRMLASVGLDVKGKVWDTLILAHVADSSRPTHALKPICKAMFDFDDGDLSDLKDSVKKGRSEGKKKGYCLAEDVEADYHLGDPDLCKKYAVGDTQRAMLLWKAYSPFLTNPQPLDSPFCRCREVVDLEHKLLPVVMEMTNRGCSLDDEKIAELAEYYSNHIEKYEAEKADLGYADLNPKSSQQKAEVFYEELGFEKEMRKRKKRGEKAKKTATTDKSALAKWAKNSPLAKCLLEISEAKHQLTSFIHPFSQNSIRTEGYPVLHTNFKTCGPITGRLSSSGPNLQNITSDSSAGKKSSVLFRARECFVPRSGHVWVLADYSQIEIWCTAFLSQDTAMMQALMTGQSLHDVTCMGVFGARPTDPDWDKKRKASKNLNFALQYGARGGQLAFMLGCDVKEANYLMSRYWDTYAGLAEYIKVLEKQYKKDGHVMDPFGRTYRVSEDRFTYKLVNYMSQGTAAGIIKRAMINLNNFFKTDFTDCHMLLQVHDELISECPLTSLCPELYNGYVKAMQGNFHEILGIPEPLKVEVSVAHTNWAEKEKICLGG